MNDNDDDSTESDRIADARRWYADEVRYASGTSSDQIVEAYSTVPRERFLGPGPWQILSLGDESPRYILTPDDDPVHVYHNALVAIDASRGLNNGSPGSWAGWLSQCHPRDGDQVLHVGCGTGYYSAILAELVGRWGQYWRWKLMLTSQSRREQTWRHGIRFMFCRLTGRNLTSIPST